MSDRPPNSWATIVRYGIVIAAVGFGWAILTGWIVRR